MGATAEPRRLNGLLILGILTFPVIFAWFVLRRGYSRDVRMGAFLLSALSVAIAIADASDSGL